MTTNTSLENKENYGNFDADGQIYLDVRGAAGGTPFNTVYANGDFGGGTLKVQASPDGTTWFDIEYATLNASGYINIQMKFVHIRLDLSGSITPNLDIWSV